MTLHANHIISIIAIFQAVFLSAFLVSKKKFRNSNNILLAGILFLFALLMMHTFTFSEGAWPYFKKYWFIFPFFDNLPLIIAPLVYFYFQSVKVKDFTINRRNSFHFIPFVLFTAFFVFYFLPQPKTNIIHPHNLYRIVKSLVIFHNLIYIILIIKHFDLRILKRKYKQFENGKGIVHFFVVLSVAFISFWLIEFGSLLVLCLFQVTDTCAYTTSLYFLAGFILFNSLLYIALSNQNIFVLKAKYLSSNLNDNEKNDYLKYLESYMQKEKPYLDPEISIQKLSDQLSIPVRSLSQIINEYFNKNFREFINMYRIEECKKQLAGLNGSKTNISEIFYSLGFNSKSTFNTTFKKYTGQTPTQFKQTQKN